MSLDCGRKLNFNHMFKDLKKTLYYKGVFCTSLYAPHNSETEEDHTLRYSDRLSHHPDHGRLNSVNLLPESGTFSAGVDLFERPVHLTALLTKVWFCFSEILWWWGLSQKSFSPVVQIFCLQGQPIRKVALKQLITQKGWTGVCTKALYNVEKDFLNIMNNAKLLWSQTIKIRCLKWKE